MATNGETMTATTRIEMTMDTTSCIGADSGMTLILPRMKKPATRAITATPPTPTPRQRASWRLAVCGGRS